jgi:hypothetical protein
MVIPVGTSTEAVFAKRFIRWLGTVTTQKLGNYIKENSTRQAAS